VKHGRGQANEFRRGQKRRVPTICCCFVRSEPIHQMSRQLRFTMMLQWLLLLTLTTTTALAFTGKPVQDCVEDSPNKNLCLPKDYSKFELPFAEGVNVVEIGIDISDVLGINDKVGHNALGPCRFP
jgi:hypothetical protein